MPYTVIDKTPNYSHIQIQGVFSVQDLLALQASARADLEQSHCFRVLVELQDFNGWSHEPDWENTGFLPVSENQFSRIAFVGDSSWQDDVFMFTGQPMRTHQIAFFTPDQFEQAKAWLTRDAPD